MVPRVTAVDVVRLLVEIFAVFSLVLWGAVSWVFPWSIVAAIVAPLLAIVVWGLFVSPKAVIRTHPFVRALIELLVFVAVTVAWWDMGQVWIGIAFAVVAVATGVANGLQRMR